MKNRTLLIILFAVALVLAPVVATVYYVTSDDASHTVTGSFVLSNPDHINKLGRYCTGQRDYRDLQNQMPVTMWDAHGNVIARGNTSTGVHGAADCAFHFTLHDVPDVNEYHLQAGGRPVVIFMRAQLEQSRWTVKVVLDA